MGKKGRNAGGGAGAYCRAREELTRRSACSCCAESRSVPAVITFPPAGWSEFAATVTGAACIPLWRCCANGNTCEPIHARVRREQQSIRDRAGLVAFDARRRCSDQLVRPELWKGSGTGYSDRSGEHGRWRGMPAGAESPHCRASARQGGTWEAKMQFFHEIRSSENKENLTFSFS